MNTISPTRTRIKRVLHQKLDRPVAQTLHFVNVYFFTILLPIMIMIAILSLLSGHYLLFLPIMFFMLVMRVAIPVLTVETVRYRQRQKNKRAFKVATYRDMLRWKLRDDFNDLIKWQYKSGELIGYIVLGSVLYEIAQEMEECYVFNNTLRYHAIPLLETADVSPGMVRVQWLPPRRESKKLVARLDRKYSDVAARLERNMKRGATGSWLNPIYPDQDTHHLFHWHEMSFNGSREPIWIRGTQRLPGSQRRLPPF